MPEPEFKGDPFDASWSSDLTDVDTTVEVSDDKAHNGTETTTDWPDIVPGPEDLNHDQREVIRAAVRNPCAESLREVNRAAEPHYEKERSHNYARQVLQRHWPERKEQITDTKRIKPNRADLDTVKKVRERLLDGKSAKEIAEDLEISDTTVQRYASGEGRYSVESPPPLEYDRSEQGWVPQEDGDSETEAGEDTDDSEEADSPLASVARKMGNIQMVQGEDGVPSRPDDGQLVTATAARTLPIPDHAFDHDVEDETQFAIFRDGDGFAIVPTSEVSR